MKIEIELEPHEESYLILGLLSLANNMEETIKSGAYDEHPSFKEDAEYARKKVLEFREKVMKSINDARSKQK